jgi:hypothetical protein
LDSRRSLSSAKPKSGNDNNSKFIEVAIIHQQHTKGLAMARFLFLILLVANLAFAGHIYLSQPTPTMPTELNREAMKVISITDSVQAQKDAVEAKKLVQNLVNAQCLQFSVKPADATRAQTLFATFNLGSQLSNQNIEEFTRFAIALPIQRDRKAADAIVASLKKANVKDVLIMADNSISLGLFSTEDAAKRVVSDLSSKVSAQVKGISITAKNPVVKETQFMIQSPDLSLISRVALMQRDFEASVLKGIACPAATVVETATVSPVAETEKSATNTKR